MGSLILLLQEGIKRLVAYCHKVTASVKKLKKVKRYVPFVFTSYFPDITDKRF